MKKFVGLSILMFITHWSIAQTQMEMNEDAHRQLDTADKQLNHVFRQILKEYKSDTVFIKNLKISQQRWIRFRDAEMDMMYPEREHGYYGSMHPMCWSLYKKELTDERTKKL